VNKNFNHETIRLPFLQDDPAVFQIFFLNQDENKGVEVLETNLIDFEEIVYRLNHGESIFIKQKDQEILESYSGSNQKARNS
jgi:hypothetical protein